MTTTLYATQNSQQANNNTCINTDTLANNNILLSVPTTQPVTPTELRVLRIQDVANKLGMGKSTIYDWLNEKSTRYDNTFPKPIKLSTKSIGWLSSEIDAWLLNRIALTRISD